MTQLVQLRREIPLFARRRSQHTITVGNSAPACFFLTRDGLCGVQAELGYSAKPETCRLFPFNNIRAAAGNHLVVAPHEWLCPLQVSESANSEASKHEELLNQLCLAGISADIKDCFPTGETARIVALERAIVAASEEFLHRPYLEFVREQQRLTALHFPERADGDAAVMSAQSLRIANELFGISLSDERSLRALSKVMVASTPYLRSRLMFAANRQSDRAQVRALHRTPLVGLAEFLLATAARKAGMEAVTFQTINKLSSGGGPVVSAIADANAVLYWRSSAKVDVASLADSDLRRRLLSVLRDLHPAAQRSHRVRFGDVLLRHVPTDELDRMTFLDEVFTRVRPSLSVLGQAGPEVERSGSLAGRLQGAMQQALTAHLDSELVEGVYSALNERLARRKGAP